MLLLTAVFCLILGMGLPTTANYIIVATLMAPVIVELAAKNELAVPLIAAHLFVFYFGLMADVTPPVGLASYAAAAISKASPIATGVQAFRYEIRTALLPFIFIFNTQLILIGIDNFFHGAVIVAGSRHAHVRGGDAELVSRQEPAVGFAVLLAACFTLLRPGFLMDYVAPSSVAVPANQFNAVAAAVPSGGHVRFHVVGEDLRGRPVDKTVALRLDGDGPIEQRLADAGLALRDDGGKLIVDDVRFRTEAAKVGLELDYEVTNVEEPQPRPPKELFYILGFAIAGLVAWNQRRRGGGAKPAVA